MKRNSDLYYYTLHTAYTAFVRGYNTPRDQEVVENEIRHQLGDYEVARGGQKDPDSGLTITEMALREASSMYIEVAVKGGSFAAGKTKVAEKYAKKLARLASK